MAHAQALAKLGFVCLRHFLQAHAQSQIVADHGHRHGQELLQLEPITLFYFILNVEIYCVITTALWSRDGSAV